MRRFLQHVLPKGLHKVRYYGLWHPSRRNHAARVQLMLRLQQPSTAGHVASADDTGKDLADRSAQLASTDRPRICPCCQVGHLVHVGRLYPKQVRGP